VFRAAGVTHEDLRKEINDALDAKDVDKAISLCEQGSGPVAATFLTGLSKYRRMKEHHKTTAEMTVTVSKAMEEYAPKALQGLENRLGYLVLMAGISPLIGMVGTVTGMIRAFSKMVEAAGLEPGAVAGGISEAMITTAAGLLVAVPCVVVYHVFQRRIEDYTRSIEMGVADISEFISEEQ
jgi:biopolymer transport protein ExbB